MTRPLGVICGALLASMCLPSMLLGQKVQYLSDSASGLVEQFNTATIFWKQFKVAQKIVMLHDKSILPELEAQLSDEDRHARGNAAFIFAALGDDRGFDVIRTILSDLSHGPRRPWGGFRDVAEDRYYAAWLFGQLKDQRAAPILIPLLKDPEVRLAASSALGEIGDKSAVRPLIEMLDDRDLVMRLTVIRALGKLDATEALPKLHSILNEAEVLMVIPDYGLVDKGTREAITKLEKTP